MPPTVPMPGTIRSASCILRHFERSVLEQVPITVKLDSLSVCLTVEVMKSNRNSVLSILRENGRPEQPALFQD